MMAMMTNEQPRGFYKASILLLAAFLGAALWFAPAHAAAKAKSRPAQDNAAAPPQAAPRSAIAKGYAPIVNGDIAQAKKDARKDALRNIVEEVLGVRVDSYKEVHMGILARDDIVTNSDGYVLVKGVKSEGASGNIYQIELHVLLSEQKIKAKPQELKDFLSGVPRAGLVAVALTGKGLKYIDELSMLSEYVSARLRTVGFEMADSAPFISYIDAHPGEKPATLYMALRRIAEQGEANGVVRGSLELVEEKTLEGRRGQKLYQATIVARFVLIVVNNKVIDPTVDYFTAVADSKDVAVRNAQELAVTQQAEKLAQLALESAQEQNRREMS
jgi:hypothetical protein